MSRHLTLLDYFFMPYHATLRDNELYAGESLFGDTNELLTRDTLESFISANQIIHSYLDENSIGVIGELYANHLIDINLKNRISKVEGIEGRTLQQIDAKPGHLINMKNKHIAKKIDSNRLVLLKYNPKGKNADNFGFVVNAEIDGLFFIKKRNNGKKNTKIMYAIESKIGSTKVNPEHIHRDIIIPLREMYGHNVHYVMVGMPSEMYKDEKKRIFTNRIRDLYCYLRQNDINFIPLTFPFTSTQLGNFLEMLDTQDSKRRKIVTGHYDTTNSKLEIILKDGSKKEGIFLPDDLTFLEQIKILIKTANQVLFYGKKH